MALQYTPSAFFFFLSFPTWFHAKFVLYFGLSFSFGLVIYIGVILFYSKHAMLLCTLSVLVALFVLSPGSGMQSIDYFHLHLHLLSVLLVIYVRESKQSIVSGHCQLGQRPPTGVVLSDETIQLLNSTLDVIQALRR